MLPLSAYPCNRSSRVYVWAWAAPAKAAIRRVARSGRVNAAVGVIEFRDFLWPSFESRVQDTFWPGKTQRVARQAIPPSQRGFTADCGRSTRRSSIDRPIHRTGIPQCLCFDAGLCKFETWKYENRTASHCIRVCIGTIRAAHDLIPLSPPSTFPVPTTPAFHRSPFGGLTCRPTAPRRSFSTP